MQSIKDWLNTGRNYELGIALYNAHGDNEGLKEMFAQGHSTFRAERLEKELRKINNLAREIDIPVVEETERGIVIVTEKVETVTVPISKHDLGENQVDPKKDPYRDLWMPFYQQMNLLRHNLPLIDDVAERGKMCHEVLRLERICMSYWRRAKYFVKHNKELPEETHAVEPVTDINQLHRKLMNYRTYKTKAVKILQKNPFDVKAKERVEQYTKLIEETEKRIENGRAVA